MVDLLLCLTTCETCIHQVPLRGHGQELLDSLFIEALEGLANQIILKYLADH